MTLENIWKKTKMKTNEEKAKSLWYHFCTEKSCNGHDDCKLCPKSQVHPQLLEMAYWKEQQIISQMKEFIAEYFYEHPHTSWLICSDEFQDLDDCLERLERYLKEE